LQANLPADTGLLGSRLPPRNGNSLLHWRISWRAVRDEFRNWLRLGLQAREREWKSWDWAECRCWERRDRD